MRCRPRLRQATLPLLFIPLVLLGLSSCDKGTPVAGPGTTLVVSATPLQIAANGSSLITVSVLRNGRPLPDIQVHLSSTLGRIDPFVITGSDGFARALLEGTGTSGTAKVTASSGGATAVTLDVTVGIRAERITLTVQPSAVPDTENANVSLAAVVRSDQGEPVQNAAVVFGAEIGRLTSGGSIVRTDANGRAVDSLRLSTGDLTAVSDGSIEVRAEVAGGGAAANTTGRITILQRPRASFNFSPSGLTVVFTDTSTGSPREWSWEFGDGNTSQEQNPAHTYAAPGSYVVRLTVRNEVGESTASRLVVVDVN
jgi:hypothetical protein